MFVHKEIAQLQNWVKQTVMQESTIWNIAKNIRPNVWPISEFNMRVYRSVVSTE